MRPNIDGFIVENQQTFQATGPRQLVPVIQGKNIILDGFVFEDVFQYYKFPIQTTDQRVKTNHFPSVQFERIFFQTFTVGF